jgi:hypothetical protein
MKTETFFKIGFLIVVLTISITGTSKANNISGFQNPDIRNLEPFTSIESSVDANITLIQGSASSIRIVAPQNITAAIKTVVEEGTLKITIRKGLIGNEKPYIQIYSQSFKKIKIDGNGSVNSKGTLLIRTGFELNNTAGADVNLDINAQASIVISKNTGSGKLTLTGFAKNHQASVDGTASLDAQALSTDFTLIINNGAGEARVSTNKSIEIVVNGDGNVYYRCKQTKIRQVIIGHGQAIRL